MDFLFVDDFHEVRSHGLAGYRTFHLARPAGDLDADFRILAQAGHHALRALAGTEDVNALDQNRQLDQPGEAEPPSEQGEGENDQADRGRTAPQQVIRPHVCYASQDESQYTGNHQQSEVELTFSIQARSVVEIKPMRAQQYQRRDCEDLVEAIFEVEHQVSILAQSVPCPEQERGQDDQGLSDQQDQSSDWDIDIEEPDQPWPRFNFISTLGLAVHGLAIVVL